MQPQKNMRYRNGIQEFAIIKKNVRTCNAKMAAISKRIWCVGEALCGLCIGCISVFV